MRLCKHQSALAARASHCVMQGSRAHPHTLGSTDNAHRLTHHTPIPSAQSALYIRYALHALLITVAFPLQPASILSQIGWICQTIIVFGVPYDPETYFAPSGVGHAFFWIFALLPWAPLSKATQDLASATNSDKSPGTAGTACTTHHVPGLAVLPSVSCSGRWTGSRSHVMATFGVVAVVLAAASVPDTVVLPGSG